MTELKNSTGSYTRLEQEERINELYERSSNKITQPKEQQLKRKERNKDSL